MFERERERICPLHFRYAKFVDLEKNIATTEEDALIQKVLTEKKTKRKRISNEDNEDSNEMITTTDVDIQPTQIDENDMKWAANYIEEQQTQLILTLLNDNGDKSKNSDDDDSEDPQEQNDYKSLRPTLESMGIGKWFSDDKRSFLIYSFLYN